MHHWTAVILSITIQYYVISKVTIRDAVSKKVITMRVSPHSNEAVMHIVIELNKKTKTQG